MLRACHPGPVVAVSALTTAYALVAGRSLAGALWVLSAVLAGQLSIGWQNDAIDADRDRAVARRDKPIVSGAVSRRAVAIAAVLAGAAAIPASLANGWRAGTWHLAAVGIGTAYNLGLKATPVSVLCYALAFAALPPFVALGSPGSPLGPWWAPVATASLGIGAHVLNVAPDRVADLATGVRALPHRLQPSAGIVLAAGAFVVAGLALGLGPTPLGTGQLVAAGIAVSGGVIVALVARARTDLGFRASLVLAALDVALLLLVARGHLALD